MDFAVVTAIHHRLLTDEWGPYPYAVLAAANLVAARYGFEGAPYSQAQTERSCRRLMKGGIVRIIEFRHGHAWTLSKFARRRMASDHGLYRCTKCGSTDVRIALWVACNAMRDNEDALLGDFNSEDTTTQWCSDCKAHVRVEHIPVSAAVDAIDEHKKAS
jgi:hypothetical protein